MSQLTGLGGPTPRRSGRLSSKAGSILEQSVVTTMTAGGTRQRRQGPLAKVKARRSNAYGASGRVGAAEELAISATGFAQAFQNQRGDAVARDDEEEEDENSDSVDELGKEARMSGALNSNNARKSPPHERSSPPPAPAPFTFSETPDAPFSDDDLAFSLGTTSKSHTSKSFGMEHEAGMLQEQQRDNFRLSSSPEPTPVPKNTVTKTIRESLSALKLQPIWRTSMRLLTSALQKSSRIERRPEQLIVTQSRPSPQTRPNRPEAVKQWLGGVEPGDDITNSEILEDEPEWPWLSLVQKVFWVVMLISCIVMFTAMASSTFSDPTRKVALHTAVRNRITASWYDTADWIQPAEHKYNETRVLITWLYGEGTGDDHLFWSRMWKNHREYVGKFEELESAIDKIKAELPELIVIRRLPDERLEITDEFWTALLSKAQAKSGDPTWIEFLKANRQKVQDLDSTLIDVTKPTARPQIVGRDEFVKAMQQHYDTISADVNRKIVESLKTHETIITSLIQTEARKTLMDSIRLQSLAQSNLIANYELNLKKPNYFSTGMGALVDPVHTSSTFDNGSPSLMSRVIGSTRRANPPKAALSKWDEFGECWCAAPNPMKGYARLGVSLPRYMFPKQVTVEHAPMSMSPTGNIEKAPRNIELWAETDQPIEQHYGHSHNKCLDPGDLRELGYVCLGSFKYNIHASNHVQTFDLDAQLTVPTSKVVVQVTSNWGAPNTCIYRVRLHGDDAEEKHNYDVTLND
ncbi:UNC-like C-terminal-domain-containing protein [Boeremia exigua]|uniref:UNC-like C-terminal-domain-containing protein n=1 Tax=Boeremia exigua TaxID=749465 RepID=UPI001E8D898C|nr:UNC-like C-terminal-domain-containing protein [Boeremia exigua]KAH6614208.1 UNC-like C-terminal-domain-containing protein [Boeremia exigua]